MASKGPKTPAEKAPVKPAATPPVAAKAASKGAAAPKAPTARSAPAKADVAVAPVAGTIPVAAAPAPVSPAAVNAAEPAPKPAVAVAPSIPTPPKKELSVMENSLNNTAEKTQAFFADINERTKTAMEKGGKLFADFNEFGKGNVEALVESSKIAAKGLETLGQDAADYARKSFEHATTAMRSFATVKTPAEFLKLHNDYVRSSFDGLVAETSKTTEAVLKLAGDVAQPISNRVAVAAETLKAKA